MVGLRRWGSERGFTLVETLVVLLVVALLSAGAVIAFAPAAEAPVDVSMVGDIETFAALEAQAYHVAGSYEHPRDLLASGRMQLSPGVELDSTAFTPERVYLRVRHRSSASRCSVDLSESSRNARNRVQCFGGTGRDTLERVGIGDGPAAPVADTVAGTVPDPPVAVDVVVAPGVDDPPDVTAAPGEAVDRTFLVTNRSATSRRYQYYFSSSDPALVAAPDGRTTVTITAGASVTIRFTAAMADAAAAGRLAAITLFVVDADDDALAAQGSFAAMAAVRVEAPVVVAPPEAAEIPPGDTVVLRWTVQGRSNVARMVDVSAEGASPSLVPVSAKGLGRIRLEAGETKEVVTVYRLASPSTAGSIGSVSLKAADAGARLESSARTDVVTALVVAAPVLGAPADTTVEGGTIFRREWSIASRTNAQRSYVLEPAVSGSGIESAVLVGSGTIVLPESGVARVVVEYRARAGAAAGEVSSLALHARDEGGGGETSAFATAAIAAMPVSPVVVPAPATSGYVGDTAVMRFEVRNPGNAARRYSIAVSGADPAVAAVRAHPVEIEVPALGTAEVPVVVEFPRGVALRLDAGVTVEARDVEQPTLAGAASALAARINRPPGVRISGPGRQVVAGEEVTLTIVGDDPDGDMVGYGVEFGDGMSASGLTVAHAYFAPGTYFVRARAVDAFGAVAEDSVTIQVVAPTIGCMDPAANNYNPNANLAGDCTYGPALVKTEEVVRVFVCNYEYGFVEYVSTDTWGRMYDYWSDGSRTAAGEPYRISFITQDLGPVTAAPYGLTCETYDDNWP